MTWNDNLVVKDNAALFPSKRAYIDSDPTSEAAINSLDKESMLEQINMSYSLKRKDPSGQKKHIWQVVLHYKKTDVAFITPVGNRNKPEKLKILNELARSFSIVNNHNYKGYCYAYNLEINEKSGKRFKAHQKKAAILYSLLQDNVEQFLEEL